MNGVLENSRARVKMRATKYVKDGETYLKFEKFQLKIQIGKNTLNLKNLFNGKNIFSLKNFSLIIFLLR